MINYRRLSNEEPILYYLQEDQPNLGLSPDHYPNAKLTRKAKSATLKWQHTEKPLCRGEIKVHYDNECSPLILYKQNAIINGEPISIQSLRTHKDLIHLGFEEIDHHNKSITYPPNCFTN